RAVGLVRICITRTIRTGSTAVHQAGDRTGDLQNEGRAGRGRYLTGKGTASRGTDRAATASGTTARSRDSRHSAASRRDAVEAVAVRLRVEAVVERVRASRREDRSGQQGASSENGRFTEKFTH